MRALAANSLRTALLTTLTMICFAANSVLARLALREEEIDGGTFTVVRIFSGAVVLALLVSLRGERLSTLRGHGSWSAALALFGYAVAFSFAYLWLDAGVGALILFAAVQVTMIAVGMIRGERLRTSEWIGLALALVGLVYLVSPGLTAPSLAGATFMAISGVAWGFYSLAAKGARSPIAATAANFGRAAPMAAAVLLAVWLADRLHASLIGIELAMISGAVTSGLGYSMWYMALKGLRTSRAAIVQLTVPVIAAFAGVMFLDEQMTWRLALAGAAILGGVALALLGSRPATPRS
ncbi:MAG: DMT family transporter [Acidobacteria bacterium]|nr:DMT family transporter [Acidobacteriota bacterium]